ncbi:hypothetical protein [Variovorax sp. JS1663]|uniref:hypothetical protein n=1 Tax=Variovorax sp. JS1663 TaxID=1851577 RepID=UPI000B348379|nr:hypothetical protein [Variovorax sp. JS1663]OUM02850.1 hypothetical protein A8M77_09655 [Variovorax sp. JS1663]
MTQFNNGKVYHGSDAVQGGRLQGATAETDYFYFFCPNCPDKEMLRVLDHGVRHEQPDNPYDTKVGGPKSATGFVLALKVHCRKCGFTDFVKIGNLGWQGGKHQEALDSTV